MNMQESFILISIFILLDAFNFIRVHFFLLASVGDLMEAPSHLLGCVKELGGRRASGLLMITEQLRPQSLLQTVMTDA